MNGGHFHHIARLRGVDYLTITDINAAMGRGHADITGNGCEFDSHDLPCWFNEEKEKADKPRMLELLGKLNARIAELNDGSFVVDDRETPRVEAL